MPFFKTGFCAEMEPLQPITSHSNRDVDNIIFSGTSIEFQSSTEELRLFGKPYIQEQYGRAVDLYTIAVSGSNIADLVASIRQNIADYAHLRNVTLVLCHGYNDVGGGAFSAKGISAQNILINNMKLCVEMFRLAGWHVVQGTPTQGWSGGNFTTADPLQPDEVRGPYNYIRDWITPIIKEYAPLYVYQDSQLNIEWPFLDGFNWTRNFYDAYASHLNPNDTVHPHFWARMGHFMGMVDMAMLTSQSQLPPIVTKRDYNAIYGLGSALDITLGFSGASVPTGNKINWIPVADNHDGGLFKGSLIDNETGEVTALKFYTYINHVDNGGAGNSGNNEDTLENSSLLSKAVGIEADSKTSGFYSMVEGLQPFKRYKMGAVAARTPSNSQSQYFYLHDGSTTVSPVLAQVNSASPEATIVERAFLSDHQGRAYFCTAGEVSSPSPDVMLSGLNLSSEGDIDTKPPDITKPTIEINGPSTYTVLLGRDFIPPNATAKDNRDPIATIQTKDKFIKNLLGEQELFYRHTDKSGNIANPVSIIVSVVATELSETTSRFDGVFVNQDFDGAQEDKLFQNSDNIFLTEITDEKTGDVLLPSEFSNAEYIVAKRNKIVVRKTLSDGITIVDGKFLTHIDDGEISARAGTQYTHQFVVFDILGNKRPPVFIRPVEIIKVVRKLDS